MIHPEIPKRVIKWIDKNPSVAHMPDGLNLQENGDEEGLKESYSLWISLKKPYIVDTSSYVGVIHEADPILMIQLLKSAIKCQCKGCGGDLGVNEWCPHN